MVPAFTSVRLSFNVFAIFLVIGAYVPFLPVWFEGRGMTADDIGLVFAVALWVKIPISLLFASIADATGERKRLHVIVALIVLVGIIAMSQLEGFWPLLCAWAVVGTVLTTAIPLTDSLTVIAVKRAKLDYGRIRLWGSISFIAVSMGGGWYLAGKDSDHVMVLLMIGAVAMVLGALLLPDLKEPPRETRRLAMFDLIKHKGFILFVLTAAILQASHAGLYGFATLSWTQAGISSGTIGLLWAEGVILEILLFTFSSRVLRKLSVPQLLLGAAAAGVIRWTVIGSTAWLPALFAVQGLHALTFAGTHLAAITYITQTVPNNQSASAQGLYDGLAMGFLFGVAMALAGWLYVDLGRGTFYVMAVFSAIGALGAMVMLKFPPKNNGLD